MHNASREDTVVAEHSANDFIYVASDIFYILWAVFVTVFDHVLSANSTRHIKLFPWAMHQLLDIIAASNLLNHTGL